MIATPEKLLSPVKKDLVDRVQTRRRSITPFPADVPNRIIARVLTEESDAARPRRVYTYDEQQENRPKGENEEWLDREEFCKQYELE